MALRPPAKDDSTESGWADPRHKPFLDEEKEPAEAMTLGTLPVFEKVTGMGDFRHNDPSLYATYQDIIVAIRNEMIPEEAMRQLVEEMPEAFKRDLVYRLSSMEKSIMVSLKEQLSLVDKILKSFVNDGNVVSGVVNGMTAKDAVNMSLRLTSALATHMPKLVKADRVQNMENALFEVVEDLLTAPQRDAVMRRLEEMDRKSAARS